jgi:integrase
MDTTAQRKITLRQGKLVVFTRAASPFFQCRIKLREKPYVYKSLQTTDEAEARQMAEDLYAEAKFKAENGMSIQRRTFKNVATEYLTHLRSQVEGNLITEKKLNDQRKVIDRYLIPYFGQKMIDTITDADVYRWQDWRETYWTTGPGGGTTYFEYERRNSRTGEIEIVRSKQTKPSIPSTSTKRTEASYLRAIFDQALKWGYVQSNNVPSIMTERLKSQRRPHFDIRDYRRLTRISVVRCRTAINERVRLDPQLLHDWMLIMANSGMRPTEAKNLRWKDVSYIETEDGGHVVQLLVQGKGKRRELIAMPHTKIYLERLRERTRPENPDDYVFRDEHGNRIESFKKGFDALCKDAGVLFDRYGDKRAPYSLRHTYATFALIYGRVSVYTLAVNMGTRVDMIEKHYGHVKPLQAHKELTARYKMDTSKNLSLLA